MIINWIVFKITVKSHFCHLEPHKEEELEEKIVEVEIEEQREEEPDPKNRDPQRTQIQKTKKLGTRSGPELIAVNITNGEKTLSEEDFRLQTPGQRHLLYLFHHLSFTFIFPDNKTYCLTRAGKVMKLLNINCRKLLAKKLFY